MSNSAPTRVVVVVDKYVRAWPGHTDAPRIEYDDLACALTCDFETDAHFTAYRANEAHRLDSDALDKIEVQMVAFVADIDDSIAHEHQTPARDEWRTEMALQWDRLRAAHPDVLVYDTRGGSRIVARLASPFVMRVRDDGAAWRVWYLGAIAYLLGAFGIACDPTCADWTRLYRLPHALRDPSGEPESRAVLGDPYRIGVFDPCPDRDRDLAAVRRMVEQTRGPNGKSVWDRVALILDPPPPPSRVVITTPSNADHSRRWGDGALRRACAIVSGAAAGSRNETLRAQSYGIGRLVAGGVIDEQLAADALESAAMQAGPNVAKIRRTIRDAFIAARAKPRGAPDAMSLDRLEADVRQRPGIAFSRDVLGHAAFCSVEELELMAAALRRAGVDVAQWARVVLRQAAKAAA